LNSPGNLTASKLKWVKDNRPETYARIHKIMLPGDYIAFRMTGEMKTTVSGLSEGILWDAKNETISHDLLKHYGISESLLCSTVPQFGEQGFVTPQAAESLGISSTQGLQNVAHKLPISKSTFAVSAYFLKSTTFHLGMFCAEEEEKQKERIKMVIILFIRIKLK
jgi:glycerol kinase